MDMTSSTPQHPVTSDNGVDEGARGSIADMTAAAKARMAQIPLERLVAFLESQREVIAPVEVVDLTFVTAGSGSSNGIALFTGRIDRGSGPEELGLVLRYSPGIQLLKQKSYAEEFQTLQAVHAAGLAAPRPLWLDASGDVLGRPGYVMERIDGQSPNAAMYSSGVLAEVSPDQRKTMMLAAAGFHGQLRKAAIGADQVPHLATRGEGNTPIERELSWWRKEAALAARPDDPRLTYVVGLHDWLAEHQPKTRPATLVHGDAQIANLMYRDGELVAAIDWELSYLGHNEADLALVVFTTETQKVLDASVEGTPTEEEYIVRYEADSGASVEHWEYFQLFNLAKVITIMVMMADTMPAEAFAPVWQFYRGQVDEGWNKARRAV
jgi:aminoglycoside phosphotransferase (APT) family kinase protein